MDERRRLWSVYNRRRGGTGQRSGAGGLLHVGGATDQVDGRVARGRTHGI